MMNLPGAGPTGKKYIFDRDDENPNRICTGQFGVDLFLVLFGNLPFRLRRPNELNTPSPAIYIELAILWTHIREHELDNFFNLLPRRKRHAKKQLLNYNYQSSRDDRCASEPNISRVLQDRKN
jgi:hypothetical protein